MRRIIGYLTCGVWLLTAGVAVAALSPGYEQELVDRVRAAFAAPSTEPSEQKPHRVCGTLILMEIRMAWPELSETARQAIDAAVQTTRPTDLDEYYDTPDGIFRIHYTRIGSDSVNLSYGLSAGGVPNYVLNCAELAAGVVALQNDTLGFHFPICDTVGQPEEDPRFDIYLESLDQDYYGLSYQETAFQDLSTGIVLATAWMKLRCDYTDLPGYEDRPFEAMAVTLAHEWHHACQWAYDAVETEVRNERAYPWWLEASAVAMEEVTYPEVDDYLGYLPAFFNNPGMSLRMIADGASTEAVHAYASAIWPLFLAQRHTPVILREIWDVCGEQSGFNTFAAYRTALAAHGSTFEAEWAEFLVWNYFTSSRATDWGYTEGAAYPRLRGLDSAVYSEYPVADTSSANGYPRNPDELAAAYLRFVPVYGDSADTFTLNFSAEGFNDWMIVTAGINGSIQPQVHYTLDAFDPIQVPDWQDYGELLVIISPFKPDPQQDVLDRSLQFDFAVLDTLTDNRATAIYKIYSNPLVLTDGGEETFRLLITRAQSVPVSMSVYTLNGELIRGGAQDDMYWSAGRSTVPLVWDGTNRDDRRVASGVYLALVQLGNRHELVKVAVKNAGP